MNPLKLITKPIGCLCSLLGALILGVFLLGLLGLWSFNYFAHKGMEEIIESRGGFPVTVDDAGWHLWDSAFVAEDIIVQNPPNFPEKDFLHIRNLSLSGDGEAWLSGETRDLDELTLDIERINWVTTEGGSSNVALFTEAVLDNNENEPSSIEITGESQDDEVNVALWVIRIGTVEVSDYSRGEVKREKYVLNYERRFVKGEPASVVIQIVSSEFEDKGLQPMLHQLLTGILSVPDLEGLSNDLNPAPDWLKEKLKSDDSQ